MKNHQNLVKKTIKNLGARIIVFLQFFSLTLGNSLIFNSNLFTGSLSGTQNSYSEVHFNTSGDNFPGIIFWDTGLNLEQTHELIFNGSNKLCDKQVKGTYHNSSRGVRLRPLDHTSLADLKTVDNSYNNLELTGGFFYDCAGEDFYKVFGQITHTYNNTDYKMIAGVEFTGNTYTANFANTLEYLTPNGLISTGKIFDSYGGVATLQGSGNLDFEAPIISLLSPDNTTIINTHTTNLERTGSDNFNINGYHYQFARDIGFTNIITESDTNNTGVNITELADNIYYWRVSAEDFVNNITTSTIRSFEVSVSDYIWIPTSSNNQDIINAFLGENYQTGAGALNTVSNDTLVGYTGIDLNTNGQICPEVPVIFQSSGTRGGNILEMEINNCIVVKTPGGNNYSGILNTPSFTGTANEFELINIDTDTIAQIGPNQTLNLETTGGNTTTVILRIPTPGITIGNTVQIYSSTDTNNRTFEGTTTATDIGGESYAIFTTNHLTYFSLGTETGNFVINNDDATTTGASVTLNMSVSGATEMRFGNNSSDRDSATRGTYATSTGRTLTSGNGTKTVYAEFKDSLGQTGIVNDQIELNDGNFSIVFTGDTAADGYTTTNTSFTGEVEITNTSLKKLTRNRDGTAYIYDITSRYDYFETGNYSITDYTNSNLILTMNFDNITNLGENSTTVKDFSTNNMTGTVTNATWTGNGKLKGAYYYSGNDYISISNTQSANQFTFSAWIKKIIDKNLIVINNNNHYNSTNGYGSFAINLLSDNLTLIWDKYNGSSYAGAKASFDFNDGERHFISINIDSINETVSIFIDGKIYNLEDAGGSTSYDLTRIQPLPIATLYIGAKGNLTTTTTYGLIDNVRIYNNTKTKEQNKQIYGNIITKYNSGTRGLINNIENLIPNIYTYQACATNTGDTKICTNTRTLNIINTGLLIYKTSNDDIYNTEDVISYTIVFSNTGDQTITGVVIKDILLTGLEFTSYTVTGISNYNFGTGLDNSGNMLIERSGFNLATGEYGLITINADVVSTFHLLDTIYYDLSTGFITKDFWENNPTSGEIIEKLYGTGSPYTQIRENYTSNTCNITTGDIIEMFSGDDIPSTLLANKIYLVYTGEYKSTSTISINNCTALIGIGNVEISTSSRQTNTVIVNEKNNTIIDNIKIDGSKGHLTESNTYCFNIYDESNNNTANTLETYNCARGINIYLYEQDSTTLAQTTKNNLINNSISYNNDIGFIISSVLYDPDESIIVKNNIINNCQAFNNSVGFYLYSVGGSDLNNTIDISYNTISNSQTYNNENGVTLQASSVNQGNASGNLYIRYNSLYNMDIYNNNRGINMFFSSDGGYISNNNFSNIKLYNNNIAYNSNNNIGTNKYYNPLILFDNDTDFIGNGLTAGGTEYSGSMGRTGGKLATGGYMMTCDYTNNPRDIDGVDLHTNSKGYCNTRGIINSRDGQLLGIRYGYFLTHQTKPIRYTGTTLEYYGTKYIDYFEILENARISPLEWILNEVTFSGDNIMQTYILNDEYQNTVDLRVSKSVTGNYSSGGTVTYTITYGNSGYDTDTVTIIDTLSGERLSGQNYSGIWTYSGNNIFYTGFSLTPSTSGSIILTATILTGTDLLVGTNTVNISGLYYDINTSNNTDSVNITISGDDITVPIIQHISPINNSIFEVSNIDLLRSGSDNRSISGYYYQIYRLDNTVWTDILSGTTINTGITLTGLQAKTYKRQIKAEDVAGNQSNRHTAWTFEANKYINLQITKIADKTGYYYNNYITYTINFINSGTITKTGIEITDTIITGLDYISSTFTGPIGYAFASGLNTTGETWLERSGFDLNAGETGQIIITGQIIKSFSGKTIDNKVFINNILGLSESIYQQTTDLFITKSVIGDYYSGGVVEYTITYGNSGYDTATNIEIIETPDIGLSGINFAGIRIDKGDGTFTTTVSDLTVGETGSLVFTATIITGDQGGVILGNTISITGYYFDKNAGNNINLVNIETVDITLPRIELIEPTNNTYINTGYTNLIRSGYDSAGISGYIYEIFSGGVSLESGVTTNTGITIINLIEDTSYTRHVNAEDNNGNRSSFTNLRAFNVDFTRPYIYFTGNTPPNGTITGVTYFHTGEVEVLEDNLVKLIRNRNGTDYIFNITGWFDSFGTGDYSLTNYSKTGLVLAMNFDTNGDVNDYSIYNNTGTNNGATWTSDGAYQGAYYFTNNSTNIQIPDDDALDVGTGSFSISLSFKILNNPSTAHILSKVGTGGDIIENSRIGYNIYISSAGLVYFRILNSDSNIYTSAHGVYTSKSFNDGLLHTLVITTDRISYSNIYIDGIEQNTSTYTAGGYTNDNLDNPNLLNIGSFKAYGQSPVGYFPGTIDNIRIYKRTISSGEAQQIHAQTITKYSTGLRGLTTIHTGLSDGTYDYQACAEDTVGNTGCTETRDFTVDTIDPYIYFTGSTPTSGIITTNTTFTGEIEVLEPHLSGLIRNRDGTEYILSLNDHRNIFNTGNYSRTNYEETGLVLAMNFDNMTGFGETTTIVADLAGGNNTGTIIPVSSHRTGDEGVYGGSFFFSGWDTIAVEDDQSVSSKIVTISTRTKGTGWVLRHGLGNDEIYSMRINNNKLCIEYREDAGFRSKCSSETFNNSKRNHLTITRDNNNLISFFINGKFINSEQGAEARSGGNLVIGGGGNSLQPYNGYIDDLRIYNRVLSSDEIRQLYSTNVTKPADEVRSFTVTQEDLTDGTYTYSACAEDQVNLTGCTDTPRTYTVQTPKTITVKTANQYTTSGDFWLFEQTGATSRRQIFNSAKIINDITPNINYSSSTSTGQISITGELFPTSGATYLAVYKLTGTLAVGYTGIRQNNITGFDFSKNSISNLYPKLPYQNENYLFIGDLDTSSSGAYDLIYGPDLALLNTKLSKNTLSPLKPIYDFDYNEVATALEQAMILYNVDIGGYIQDYLPDGLDIIDFKNF